jgi:thymidylate kinase
VTAAFLGALFEAWDRAGVRHAVLRNYERWPDDFGKDIDLLVHADDLARAGAEIRRLARAQRLLCVTRPKRSSHTMYEVVATEDDAGHVLLDLSPDCVHRGLVYLPGALVLASRRRLGGFHVAAPGIERLALLLHCIVDCREMRRRYAARLAALPVDDDFRRTADAVLGPRLAARLAETPPEDALALRRAVVRAAARRNPRSVGRWAGGRAGAVADRVRAWVRPPGQLIIVLGPDGAGKSTLTALLCERLKKAGLHASAVYLGSQNPLLPTRRLSQQLRRRRHPGYVRPIKDEDRRQRFRGFVHILADKWLRYLVQIRPRLVRGEVVIADRYFYDLRTFPNPLVRHPWVEAFITRLVPRPTLAFNLHGEPAVIAARKRELTVGETARQLACFREVRRWVKHFRELPADGDVIAVAWAMRAEVVQQWAGACATKAESPTLS